ncbi:ribose 5-phosphate isomerase A [Desulfobacterota bacterium AH_259_B03_O07]|nr:ribose 5-phosphate isomerase A [Desulfobacterota bacterium AH_259_B03_O07]
MNEAMDSEQIKLQDRLKKEAGQTAADLVESGMVVGLGTGTTTRFALEEIGNRIKSGKLKDIIGISSSIQTERRARELGIDITTFDDHQEIDLTIDGADEVDPNLNLIKGGGGALLREKVLAQSSRRNIMIVDESKVSPKLGTHWPVPIEVIPFAWKPVEKYLNSLGAKVALRKNEDGIPYTTDQNNFILDSNFGPIAELNELALKLGQKAGIVEYGLFIGTASEVIVAATNGIRYLKRENL